jgi:hypothetical protein
VESTFSGEHKFFENNARSPSTCPTPFIPRGVVSLAEGMSRIRGAGFGIDADAQR